MEEKELPGELLQDIKNFRIRGSSGKLNLDSSVWRDSSQHYLIYWADSKLVRRKKSSDGKEKKWHIEVRLSDVEKILQSLDNERRNAVRKRASKKNQNKGGRPPKYDWIYIDGLISTKLKEAEDGQSNVGIARQVIAQREAENIEPPLENQMRARVKKGRES